LGEQNRSSANVVLEVVIIKLAKFVVRVEVVFWIGEIVLEFLEGNIVVLLLEHDQPTWQLISH